jgi:hypothetical protein
MSELAAGQRSVPGADYRSARHSHHRSSTGGLVASVFGCMFGLIGIFVLAIIFVPLAVLCSAVGLLQVSRIWIAGVALVGLLLAAAGFATSPTLLLIAGALSLLPANQTSTAPSSAVQPAQRQATVLPVSNAASSAAQRSQSNRTQPEQIASTASRFVPLASEPGLHWSQANATAEWFEITQPMVGCSEVQDGPELQQSARRAIIAWAARATLPAGCQVIQPGKRLLLDTEQTEPQRQQMVKLWEMNCRSGCVPFASPVYMPPWRAVGPYLRPSAPPPGWE